MRERKTSSDNIVGVRQCQHCQKEYIPKVSSQKYCCPSCKDKAKFARLRKTQEQPTGARIIPCKSCNKDFLSKAPFHIFCSTKCSAHHYHVTHREERIQYMVNRTRIKLKEDPQFRKEWIKKSGRRKKASEAKAKMLLFNLLGNCCEVCGIAIPTILAVHHTKKQGQNRVSDGMRYRTYLKQYHAGEELHLLCFNDHALFHQGKIILKPKMEILK